MYMCIVFFLTTINIYIYIYTHTYDYVTHMIIQATSFLNIKVKWKIRHNSTNSILK